jgi:hypothetical protein
MQNAIPMPILWMLRLPTGRETYECGQRTCGLSSPRSPSGALKWHTLSTLEESVVALLLDFRTPSRTSTPSQTGHCEQKS